jgi:thiamine pyrophosphate-dependent acetolactate synthase large subunit-like protein
MLGCEVLLMLGTDFPYRQFYPDGAAIVQIDLRAETLGRRAALAQGLVGDVKTTIAALLPRLGETTERKFLDKALAHYRDARKGLDDLATGAPGRKPIHPQFVARTVSEVAGADAVFTCDVGTPTVWAARYLEMNGRRRLIGSFNHGSMANALPQAIGAQAAFPKRQVISLSGDGGLAMLMGELLTLAQSWLPVKVVLFNNGTLGFVEMEQMAAGQLGIGVELDNPDFGDLAKAAGLFGMRVDDPGRLRDALGEAFAFDGPALVDVVVNRQELAMPPKLSREQVLGFSLYVGRAILNGRGDEVVELARTNLFR